MSPAMLGALLGLAAAGGVLTVIVRVRAIRRTPLQGRVLPYLRDLPPAARPRVASTTPRAPAMWAVFGPPLGAAAGAVERVLGGAASVRRRLERAGMAKSVHEFRIEQVLWGLAGFAIAAAFGLVRAATSAADPWASLLICALAFVFGVLARDTHLTSQVKGRERAMVAEFPTIAELLALAVAAGEGPVAALDRVVRRSGGELSRELAGVLAAVRTGEPVAVAFDRLAARTGLPLVARFAAGVAVAVERGTPLADVLHAQAADVREAGRRELIESAARREVVMMVPVVFLVLPITVLIAFWPGMVGLNIVAP